MPIEYKTFQAEVKAFDDENLILEHFISTEHLDYGGDVMRAKGMKFVGKPVVLLLHGRGSMSSEPVGKPLSLDVDEFRGEPGILAKTQYFPDEVGMRLYKKGKGGYMPNWSIGYSVIDSKDLVKDGKIIGRDVTKWILHEYSPVGVGMNPFAQTIKDFLAAEDAGKQPDLKEAPRWFGFVDVRGKCETCKAAVMVFTNSAGDDIGIACENCQPEEFARLTEAIKPPLPKCAACGDTKVVKGELDGKPFEEPCPKCCAAPPDDPMKDINEKILLIDERTVNLPAAIEALKKSLDEMSKGFAKLEPLLKTLPPEPDGGGKGDGSQSNPPGTEEIPLLVFKPADKSEEARKKEEREQAVAAVAKAIAPIFKAQIDKIMGRVP